MFGLCNLSAFTSLFSILSIIFLGIVTRKKKVFNATHVEGLEILLFKIVLPAYLFTATYKHDLKNLYNMIYINCYILTFLLISVFITLVYYKKKSLENIPIRILSASYVNTSMYVIPVLTLTLNDPTAGIIGNLIQIALIQPIFILIINHMQKKDFFKNVIKIFLTPLIIMPILGVMLNYFTFDVPLCMQIPVKQIGYSASGIALFYFGLTLGGAHLTKRCLTKELKFLVFCKNAIHPMIGFSIAHIYGLEAYWKKSLLIATFAPTPFIILWITKQFSGVDEKLVYNVIVINSILSLFTLAIIIFMI